MGSLNIQARNGRSAVTAVAITAVNGGSNQTLTTPCRAIYVGGAGNLVATLIGDTSATTFTGLLAGSWYPFAIKSIAATGTTITNSLALL